MDAKIKKVAAREILDSRGFPTVETDVNLSNGSFGRAAYPARFHRHARGPELRDGGKRYWARA